MVDLISGGYFFDIFNYLFYLGNYLICRSYFRATLKEQVVEIQGGVN